MFEKKLIEDLTRIFEVHKVKFQSLDTAIEQDCLYCDIENVKENLDYGKAHFLVTGTLGIVGQRFSGYKYGYLMDRIRAAEKQGFPCLKNFLFWRQNEPINWTFEDNILQSRIRFKYSVSLNYDPAQKAQGANIWVKFIEYLKGFIK